MFVGIDRSARRRAALALTALSLAAVGPATSTARDDGVAERAHTILRDRCYRCHGADGQASKGVFVLDRDRLLASRTVVPGDASSPLLRLVESGAMPLGGPPLGEAERVALREWILAGALAWRTGDASDGQAFVTERQIVGAILRDLDGEPAASRQYLRYFSLAHLANAGVTEDLDRYRGAVSKLVNSLSWQREIAVPKEIGPGGVLLRVDLRDYGWTAATWQSLEARYPYSLRLAEAASVARETGAALPYLKADWFVATASIAPLYYQILGLPRTVEELERLLSVDVLRDLSEERRVVRAGVRASGVSQSDRAVERHVTAYGAYWKSFDYRGRDGRGNVFADPVSLRPDGGEHIFNLPNGLQGYFLADGNNRRVESGPVDIVSDRTRPDDPVVRAGRSCMSCHSEGMKPVRDDVRAMLLAGGPASFDRAKALALYAPQERLDALLAEDRERFTTASDRAGAPATPVPDAEPVGALARRYAADLDVGLAASEVGMRAEEFRETLRRLGPSAVDFAQLLAPNGGIKRAAWEASYATLARQVGLDAVGASRWGAPATDQPAGQPLAAPSTNAPVDVLRIASRVSVSSNTMFFTPQRLEDELRKRAEFVAWGMEVVTDDDSADLLIVIDRPLFTYTYTFTVINARTRSVVASGKLLAFDGNVAAPKLAKAFVEKVKAVRPFQEEKKK